MEVHHEFQDRGSVPRSRNFQIVEVSSTIRFREDAKASSTIGCGRGLEEVLASSTGAEGHHQWWFPVIQHEDGEDGKEEERVDKNCLAVGCEAAEFNVAVVAGYLEYEAGGEEYK
ncbi:hypothetical protein LWI29_005555 [Acer saccharum]|uniref:Uncharacterized protein n=1 Tax=Acer saccharum TaxID=4024 RepID=A0AA39VS79_ACESA|nr:hypothetical protein LWI29_005555 [Acer saccharum]